MSPEIDILVTDTVLGFLIVSMVSIATMVCKSIYELYQMKEETQ